MSKITEFARGKDCTARIPGYCNHDPATSIWAHLNSIRWGAGRGIKSKDACGLIACSVCHDVIDHRIQTEFTSVEIQLMAMEGHMESLMMLLEEGVI